MPIERGPWKAFFGPLDILRSDPGLFCIPAISAVPAGRFSLLMHSFSYSEGLRFMFAQRRIKTRLPCAVFSFQDKDKENMDYYFAGAYMKRHSLQFARKSSLHFPIWFRRTNEPCEGLRSLQLKKLTPQQSLHDPCIVAALVALARLQRIRPYQGSAPISHGSTTTFKVNIHQTLCVHVIPLIASILSPFLSSMRGRMRSTSTYSQPRYPHPSSTGSTFLRSRIQHRSQFRYNML